MRGQKIPGHDYHGAGPVSLTAAEWRKKYPADKFRRETRNGETWYFAVGPRPPGTGSLAAEAYAVIAP